MDGLPADRHPARRGRGEDGRAVMELLVGARTCPALATEVRVAIGRQLDLDRLVATLATGVQLLRAGAG